MKENESSRTPTKRNPYNGSIKIIALIVFSHSVFSQNEQAMQKYIDAGTPGPNHKKLGVMVGKWSITSEELQGEGKPPVVSKGTAEVKWVNDGRALLFNTTGTQFGMRFSSVSLMGYNNLRKKVTSVWTDNSSTSFFITEGSIDEKGELITLFGKTDDPGTDEFDKNWKVVWRISPNKLVQEYHDMSSDNNTHTKMFQIIFERIK
jgi:Protein of unknown function (DUF1579)